VSDDKKQIPMNQERLEKAITSLKARINDLSGMLEPLMKIATPPPSREAEKAEALVEYADFLRSKAEEVEAVEVQIRSICHRLQV